MAEYFGSSSVKFCLNRKPHGRFTQSRGAFLDEDSFDVSNQKPKPAFTYIMATTAIRELQMAALPAAVGTVAILYSNLANMFAMGKFRYANKGVEVHPYKPWSDTTPNAEEHFRAYKAFENGMEWTVIAVPALWLYVLYTPAVPHVGKFLPWTGALLAAAFAYYNTKYLEGYAQSVEARLPPFKARTNALMVLFTGALASMAASFLTTIGIVKMITPKVCERM